VEVCAQASSEYEVCSLCCQGGRRLGTSVASKPHVLLLLLLLLQVVLDLYAEALEKVPFFRGQHP
jgi:hypothetical protein